MQMRLCPSPDGERGQSEVIGVALLIGVIVTVVFGVGALVIADWQSGAEDGQQAAIQSDVTATGWTIEHMGGDSAGPSEIEVILQKDADTRLSLDDANVTQTAGTRPRFEPGSRWSSDFASLQRGVVEILVIHQPSNTVLHEATYEVGQRGIELVVDDTTLQNGTTTSYRVFRLFERESRTDISSEAGLTVESRNRTIASVDETNTRITSNGAGVVTVDASFDRFTTTARITVTEVGFDVTIDDIDDAVTAGDDVTVEYTASNTGSVETTQPITFAVNGSTQETTDVTLGPGETRSGTFTYRTTTADAPAITVLVSSGDDNDTAAVTVDTPPYFETTILNTSSPVVEGETLTVNATVENTGTAEGTQSIELEDFDGNTVDNRSVTLAGQRSRTVQLAWNTTVGDAGTDPIAVTSENDTATRDVTIDEPAFFDVTIDGTNATVAEGNTLGVTVTVENTGDRAASQTLELFDYENTTADSENVTLDAGASRTLTLSWDTESGDAGNRELTATTEDDTDTQTATIAEPAFFAVTLDDVEDAVTAGETVTVNYTVENTGGVDATQDIEFLVNGTVRTQVSNVEIVAGDTYQGTFTYTTNDSDTPAIAVGVSSDDEQNETTVTVNKPAFFAVTLDDVADTVTAGETVTVNYTVENTGGVDATQDIEFLVNDTVQTQASDVELPAGGTYTGSFTYTTTDRDTPAIAVGVSSDDEQNETTVTVNEPAFFAVAVEETNSPVQEGEDADIVVNVTNTGDVSGTQTVDVSAPGLGSDAVSLSLDGGESTTANLTLSTGPGDAADSPYTAEISSENDTVDTQIEVNDHTVWARGQLGGNFLVASIDGTFTVTTPSADNVDFDVNLACIFFCTSWTTSEVTIDGQTYQLTPEARNSLASNEYVDLLDASNYEGTVESDLRAIRQRVTGKSIVPGGNLADVGELYAETSQAEPT
jgi:hypothetical protein